MSAGQVHVRRHTPTNAYQTPFPSHRRREPNCLALAAHFSPSSDAIAMWASGTGFAGVFGYAWVAVGHYMLGLSFTTVLLGATCLAAGWWWTFSFALEHPRTLDSARGLGTSLRPSEPTAEAGCEGAPDTDAVGADREPLLGRGSPLPAAESLGVRPRARAATDSRASSTGRDVEGEGWEEERSM